MNSAEALHDSNMENDANENVTARSDDFQSPPDNIDDNNFVKTVYIHRNGDIFSTSRRFVYNKKQLRTWDAFLENLTSTLNPRTGPIRSIHTPQTGTKVNSFDDILPNTNYVALAGGEKLHMIGYLSLIQEQEAAKKRRNYHIPSQSLPEMGNNLDQMTPSNVPSTIQRRLLVSGRIKYEMLKRGKTIHVFRNSDEYTRAICVLLKYMESRSIEMVLRVVGEKVILPTGLPIRRLFNMNGEVISDPDQLEDSKSYVAAGNEPFVSCSYGQTLPHIICGPRKYERIRYLNSIATPNLEKQRSRNKSQYTDFNSPKTARQTVPTEKQSITKVEDISPTHQNFKSSIKYNEDQNKVLMTQEPQNLKETHSYEYSDKQPVNTNDRSTNEQDVEEKTNFPESNESGEIDSVENFEDLNHSPDGY